MRHRKAFRKFSRSTSHRKALLKNLAMALVENGRIKTTEAKAKELRRVVERLVTEGKQGDLPAKRRVYAKLGGAGKHKRDGKGPSRVSLVVDTLFNDVAERMKDRPGGYTRVLKLGPRHGDNAPMALIEFVDYEPDTTSDDD